MKINKLNKNNSLKVVGCCWSVLVGVGLKKKLLVGVGLATNNVGRSLKTQNTIYQYVNVLLVVLVVLVGKYTPSRGKNIFYGLQN